MYVKVNCPASGSFYQSVVYAMVNSGRLLQYVVINPYTNCFELIDYLFCRAVETEKTQLRYIEKVAISLHEKEIRTVNEAIRLFHREKECFREG